MSTPSPAKQELLEIGRRYQAVRTQFDAFLRGLKSAIEPARPGVPPFDPIPSLSIKAAEGTAASVEYLGNEYLLVFNAGLSGTTGVYGSIDCHKKTLGAAGQTKLVNRFPLGQEGEVTIDGLKHQLRAGTDALTIFKFLVQEP